MFNDIAYLCTETVQQDEYLNEESVYEKKMVFVQPRSIGASEFYRAATTDFKPALTLVLADYYDYSDEPIVEYEEQLFDVIRTFRKKNRLELVLQKRMARDPEPEEPEEPEPASPAAGGQEETQPAGEDSNDTED